MTLTESQISINDRIIKSCERLLNSFISAIHDEAKGYCVKLVTGDWRVLPYELVNDISDLGCMNYSMIQN